MKYTVLRTVWREGQYEILCNILDDSSNLLLGNYIYPIGTKILPAKILDSLFTDTIFPDIEAAFNEDVLTKKFYAVEEITQILREKNYITSEQEFSEDLTPSLTPAGLSK